MGVARIFATGVHSILPQMMMTVFFTHHPQYTVRLVYSLKLTTRTLPHTKFL